MDPHECVPETVDTAVALEARSRLRTDRRRVAGPPRIDVGRDARHETVREAGRAARVVVRRQVVHQRRERDARLAGVAAANGVHHAVAIREQEAALLPGRVGDCANSGLRVVPAADDRDQLARVTGAGLGVGEEAAALGVACPCRPGGPSPGRRRAAAGRSRRGDAAAATASTKDDAAAAPTVSLRLDLEALSPFETLPLMSFAIHLNLVVLVMWNT